MSQRSQELADLLTPLPCFLFAEFRRDANMQREAPLCLVSPRAAVLLVSKTGKNGRAEGVYTLLSSEWLEEGKKIEPSAFDARHFEC